MTGHYEELAAYLKKAGVNQGIVMGSEGVFHISIPKHEYGNAKIGDAVSKILKMYGAKLTFDDKGNATIIGEFPSAMENRKFRDLPIEVLEKNLEGARRSYIKAHKIFTEDGMKLAGKLKHMEEENEKAVKAHQFAVSELEHARLQELRKTL